MELQIPTEIESERLLLRAPRAGDGAVVHDAVHESWDVLTQWMPWAVTRPTLEESEQVQAEFAKQFEARTSFNMLIFCKKSTEFVGYTRRRIKYGILLACGAAPNLSYLTRPFRAPKISFGLIRTDSA